MYGHSVDKCITESHADIENVNGLQGTIETPGNPSAVEQSIDTDKSEDHCMHVWGI